MLESPDVLAAISAPGFEEIKGACFLISLHLVIFSLACFSTTFFVMPSRRTFQEYRVGP